jgi:hypothetical protein
LLFRLPSYLPTFSPSRIFVLPPHSPEQRAYRIVRRPEAGETRKFHVCKTRRLEQTDLIPDRDRTPDSLRPGFKASCHACREFPFQNDIGELKPPSRFKDAMDFLEAGLLVW